MSKSDMIKNRVSKAKRFYAKVRKLRAANSGMTFEEARRIVKGVNVTDPPEPAAQPEPLVKWDLARKNEKLVLFVSGKTFKLCAIRNGGSNIDVEELHVDVVTLG